jgi:hypothetical protein
MIRFRTASIIASAALLLAPLFDAQPAAADGAASTRNIIFGAAAVAGTLLIINHNKKVHERYAEDARRQAALADQRDDAQAAYASERRAYQNEVALVQSYQHEVALQHGQVARDRAQISALQHQVALTRQRRDTVAAAPQQAAPALTTAYDPAIVSYGWGTL